MIPAYERSQSGCHLNDQDLAELYSHLFNAINPQVSYSNSPIRMTKEALNVTQNNLKYLLKIIQTAMPQSHPLQEEMQMLLSAAEQKTATQPPIIKQEKHGPL